MPDEVTQTVTLPAGDWQIMRVALYELPIKLGLATLQRFEQALATPPDKVTRPHVVEASDG